MRVSWRSRALVTIAAIGIVATAQSRRSGTMPRGSSVAACSGGGGGG